jgi:hypothetical protein
MINVILAIQFTLMLLIFIAMHRIVNRLLDVMLPNTLQDLRIPINKAEIKEILVRDAERQKHQEALLWAVNVSTLIDYTDLDNKAEMLVDVRQHFRVIQEQQVELVMSSMKHKAIKYRCINKHIYWDHTDDF